MTNFVISLPGTFKQELTQAAKAQLLGALRGADPQEVGSDPQDLDMLTLNEGSPTFTLRLEVTAEDSRGAEREALAMASRALALAGFQGDAALLGQPAITSIDTSADSA
ncbi:hypothetical protein GCM10010495_04080 [Kitasatospora herbaricolor]|uniref:hypothetical protein n=1 Tax=Kitasatospora herbaricolor TaxID=68217 RepID=UPI00174C5DCE|nr:hypothetical protein [Kitasatospora herbaricolor]MDQ0311880.1 hypothetical protein [Kitasatospora herbaricolor]GGU96980.1 hypothetical protein GCM10010495_04080 [Kitasatospora herbaricolor]